MATGYTCIVEDRDDVTFEQYLWRCARAFSPFVREDSLDAAVPQECKPDEYYEKQVRTAREALRVAEETPPNDAMAEENRRRLTYYEEDEARRKEKTARYDRMKEQVRAWRPPTPEHEALKTFMLEQLLTGWPGYQREPGSPPEPATDPAAWRAEKIEAAREVLLRAEKRFAEEVERYERNTAWIRRLNERTPWVSQPKE